MSFLEIYRFEKRGRWKFICVFTGYAPESCANPAYLSFGAFMSCAVMDDSNK